MALRLGTCTLFAIAMLLDRHDEGLEEDFGVVKCEDVVSGWIREGEEVVPEHPKKLPADHCCLIRLYLMQC